MLTKRINVFNQVSEPPGSGAPADSPVTQTPAPPQTPPGTPPTATPAAPPSSPAPAAAPQGGWEQVFPGAKPEDVVLALRTLKGEVDRLKGAPPAAPAAPAPAEPDIKEMILDDPERALDKHLDKRVGPIVREFYDHAAQMTKLTVFQQTGEKGKPRFPHATRFSKDIDAFMQNVDPRLRTKPESWESAYNFVVGANYDKLVEEARAQGAPPIEGAGGAPGAPQTPKVTLDEQEQRVAKGMGMSAEEYANWRDGKS